MKLADARISHGTCRYTFDIQSIYTHTFVYVCMLLIAGIISRLLRTDKYRTIQNCKIAMTQDASKHAISNFHIFSFHRSSSHHNAHTASRFPRLRGQMLFRLFLYNRLLIGNLCRNFVGMRIALRKERKKERWSTLNIYRGEDLRIEEKIKNNKVYTIWINIKHV